MLYALVLASAFLHAAWNALAKRARDPEAAVPVLISISGVLAAGLAVFQLASGRAAFGARAAAFSVLAGLCEARYFRSLGRALTAGPLGPVYTISRGGALVLIWPLSALLLDEPVSSARASGSLLILAGLAASSLERDVTRAATLRALEVALVIAAYHFAYKLALDTGSAPAGVFATSIGVATTIELTTGGPVRRRAFARTLREAPGAMLLAGAVCAAAFLLFLMALARGGAGYVFTLRNASVLFALLFAALQGERPTPRRIAGAGLVFAGALLLGGG